MPDATKHSGVSLGFIHGYDVAAMFMTSLNKLLSYDSANSKHIISVISEYSTVNINNERNNVVRDFLAGPTEWLLMLDADVVFKETLVEDLLASRADGSLPLVVGGLYFGFGGDGLLFPHIYNWSDDAVVSIPKRYEPDSMVRVDATGVGCLLVHRSVFERVYEQNKDSVFPWFSESIIKNRLAGEDFTFFHRLSALGIPAYVNTSIRAGHIKKFELSESMYTRQLLLDDYIEEKENEVG